MKPETDHGCAGGHVGLMMARSWKVSMASIPAVCELYQPYLK